MAGSVSDRKERKSARGTRFAFVGLSDPTGVYEVTVFSDTLDAARAFLEPGQNVLLTVEATLEGEALKLLARSAQPVDAVAAGAGPAGLRIHLDRATAAASVAALFARLGPEGGRAQAPVILCVPDPEGGREIDVALPHPLPVTPQIRGALRAVPGVVLVEEL
jgi:DNA polymerase-3 subunit alpha